MRIENLEHHREHIATLAAWHHAQWGHLYDGWTLEMARAELEEHAPELCDEGSLWLANLFVFPEARGRGLGAQLVNAAVQVAARQEIPELFLFTPEHSAFYERLGWHLIARTTLKGASVDLMENEPREVFA